MKYLPTISSTNQKSKSKSKNPYTKSKMYIKSDNDELNDANYSGYTMDGVKYMIANI